MPELGDPVVLKAALRTETIRRTIEVDGRVSIPDLKYRLEVSEVTIREDLKYLEAAKALKRIRGGAVVTRDGGIELSLEQTSTINRAEKMAILASAFVGDISCADLLVTDSGADPPALANLRAEGLKVVTADRGAG